MLSMSDMIVGSDSIRLGLNFRENSSEMAFRSLTNSSQVWSDIGFDSSKYSFSASENEHVYVVVLDNWQCNTSLTIYQR